MLLELDVFKFGVEVTALCWLWFVADQKQRERRMTIVATAISGFAALFVARILALSLPFRDRPLARIDLGFILPANYGLEARTWSAFPSDHAVMALALVTGIWMISRPLGILVLIHAILIICMPRLYFGLHHPSDLIGGALIGILVTVLLTRDAPKQIMASIAQTQEERHHGLFYAVGFLMLFQIATMFSEFRQVAVWAFKSILHTAG